MKKLFAQKKLVVMLVSIAMTMTGCATIISGSTQAVTIKSVPDSATLSITNKSGEKIHSGQTPATVNLKRGAGFFKAENYAITLEKAGYQPKTVNVTGTVNGWYVANIVFGGLIGLLIVDPATGAMYSLSPDVVNTTLQQEGITTAKNGKERSLTVMLVQDVPADLMKNAKLIGTI